MKISILDTRALRAKKPAELNKYIQEQESALVELVHAISTNKEKKTHHIKQIKRAIAQAKTVLTQVAQGKEQ